MKDLKTKEEILEQVIVTLVTTFELDPKDVKAESHLYTDLDLDSLDAIDMAVQLSNQVGKKFDNEDLREIRTVSDVADAILRKLTEN